MKDATGGYGADAVVVTVGVAELVPGALELVRKQGAINLFAGFPPGSRFPSTRTSCTTARSS